MLTHHVLLHRGTQQMLGQPLFTGLDAGCAISAMKPLLGSGSFAVDLRQVKHLTLAAARLLGPGLQLQFMQRRTEGQTLVYLHVQPHICHSLHCSFQARLDSPALLGVAFCPEGTPCFFGDVPPHLREVLQLTYQHGGVTARQLEHLGVKAAGKKLSNLHQRWPYLLTRRTCQVEGVWWHQYHPPLPLP